MNIIEPLLRNELNELIAIIITGGNYDKNFYEGILIEIRNDGITLEFSDESCENFEFDHFILATPLGRYQ